jgi:hypothetical protein
VAERTTIEVQPGVKQQLKDYQAALHRELNRRASQGEIIAALLWGVPLWQANAMIDAHRSQHEPMDGYGSDEASSRAER